MERISRNSLSVLPSSGKVDQLRSDATPIIPIDRPASSGELEDRIIAAMRTIFDPEIPLNIYELGLIYKIENTPVDEKRADVRITMTLTAPGCPVAGALVAEVQRKAAAVEGVGSADVQLVWEPAWSKDRMSEAALLELGLL